MAYGPIIDEETCIGCDLCIDSCPLDIFATGKDSGDLPIVLYPDECWYDGACVEICPVELAIRLVHPLYMKLVLKRVK